MCMWHTGTDPMTGQEVKTARHLRDRKAQRALMQFFKSHNYFDVREALLQAGRADLIGPGCDCLIPAQTPKVALEARRRRANEAGRGDHAIPAHGEAAGERGLQQHGQKKGYRPGGKSPQRKKRGK